MFRTTTKIETQVSDLDWLNKAGITGVGGRQSGGGLISLLMVLDDLEERARAVRIVDRLLSPVCLMVPLTVGDGAKAPA